MFNKLKKVKEYKNNNEKILDFCIGLFGIYFLLLILNSFLSKVILIPKKFDLTYIVLVLIIGLLLFFRKRRKYIALGLSCYVILGMLIGILLGLGGM